VPGRGYATGAAASWKNRSTKRGQACCEACLCQSHDHAWSRGFLLGSQHRTAVLCRQHEDVSLLPGLIFRPAGRCSGPW
jgi:hypothetical protein